MRSGIASIDPPPPIKPRENPTISPEITDRIA